MAGVWGLVPRDLPICRLTSFQPQAMHQANLPLYLFPSPESYIKKPKPPSKLSNLGHKNLESEINPGP